jgi:hypothetical protein
MRIPFEQVGAPTDETHALSQKCASRIIVNNHNRLQVQNLSSRYVRLSAHGEVAHKKTTLPIPLVDFWFQAPHAG